MSRPPINWRAKTEQQLLPPMLDAARGVALEVSHLELDVRNRGVRILTTAWTSGKRKQQVRAAVVQAAKNVNPNIHFDSVDVRQPESAWGELGKALVQAGYEMSPAGDMQTILDGGPKVFKDAAAITGILKDLAQRELDAARQGNNSRIDDNLDHEAAHKRYMNNRRAERERQNRQR